MLQCAIVLIKVGNVKESGIDFTIKGESSEGPVRTTISGTIGSSTITFAESIMPNRIYKERKQPHPELQENTVKEYSVNYGIDFQSEQN